MTEAITRFWGRVHRGDGCWEYRGSRSKKGYGTFIDDRKRKVGAHRFSYQIATGRPIPDGMMVCHHCDNPSCVRPDHLFVGTAGDNARDAFAKGRGALASLLAAAKKKAAKTHCKHGHEFAPENTRLRRERSGFSRECRACGRDKARQRRARAPR